MIVKGDNSLVKNLQKMFEEDSIQFDLIYKLDFELIRHNQVLLNYFDHEHKNQNFVSLGTFKINMKTYSDYKDAYFVISNNDLLVYKSQIEYE